MSGIPTADSDVGYGQPVRIGVLERVSNGRGEGLGPSKDGFTIKVPPPRFVREILRDDSPKEHVHDFFSERQTRAKLRVLIPSVVIRGKSTEHVFEVVSF